MNVILLAGGNSKRAFSDTVVFKSLTKINGKPMVAWVAQAFLDCPEVEKICIMGPQKELYEALKDMDNNRIIVFEGSDDLYDNIESGIKFFEQDEKVLIASADIPMITSEIVAWLIDKFNQFDKDFIYTIISKKDCIERFPEMRRTYVKLIDGEFTGGNISCIKPRAVMSNNELISKLIKYRKRPDKTAKLLGMRFVMGLITGKLTINDIENRATAISGLDVSALICPFPEVGSDVDSDEDIPTAEGALASR